MDSNLECRFKVCMVEKLVVNFNVVFIEIFSQAQNAGALQLKAHLFLSGGECRHFKIYEWGEFLSVTSYNGLWMNEKFFGVASVYSL